MTDNTEALPPLPERATMSLTLADLQILAAAASRNDTHHAFQAVALEWCGKAHAEIERLRAALAQRQQVPEGWQLVPKMPTNEMINAGWQKGTQAGGIQDLDEAWAAMLAAAPTLTAAPSAQAEPQVPLTFNLAQRRRLWDNSPGIHADAKSFAAFERIVQLVEAAHGIGKQESK